MDVGITAPRTRGNTTVMRKNRHRWLPIRMVASLVEASVRGEGACHHQADGTVGPDSRFRRSPDRVTSAASLNFSLDSGSRCANPRTTAGRPSYPVQFDRALLPDTPPDAAHEAKH